MITVENERMNGLLHRRAAMDKNSIPDDEDEGASSLHHAVTFHLLYTVSVESTDYRMLGWRNHCSHLVGFFCFLNRAIFHNQIITL